MSFSKARIQRFNEFENTVPPPGAYDPKFDSKAKGPIIEKSERFHDNKSVVSVEYNVSLCSKSMGNTITNFRTRDQRQRTRSTSTVESTRKPHKFVATVKRNEMERHVEDMNEEIWQLEMQLGALLKKQLEMEEQHEKDIETLTKLQQELLNNHDQDYKAQMEELRCQLLEVSKEKHREIEARNILDADLTCRITVSSKRVIALEKILVNERQINLEKVNTLETQIEELRIKLENVAEGHTRELDSLKQTISKLNVCMGDLTSERDTLESKLQKRQNVILGLEAQLSTLQCELDKLNAEYEKLVEVSSKRVVDLRHVHQQEIDNLKSYFKREMELYENEKEGEIDCRKILETKTKDVEEENNFLKKKLEDVEKLYKNANAKVHELYDIIKSLEEKEGHVQENIDFVEDERNMWKTLEKALIEELAEEKARRGAAEEELKKLTEHNELLVKDYQEINEKYAEVVGHQNHRQRIKHVSQLKDKLYQLEQDLLGKNRVIEHLQRVVVKFKTEEKRANIKGKENLLRIVKSTDTTFLCSPRKSLIPVKNRYE